MSEKLPNMLETTIQKIRDMVDANTVVGQPITTSDGTTILPVSKISIGLGGGGDPNEAAPDVWVDRVELVRLQDRR